MKCTLLLGLLAIGCAEQPDPVDVAPVALDPDGDYQGRYLFGATPDQYDPAGYIAFDTPSSNRPGVFVSVAITGTELVAKDAAGTVLYAGADPRLIGLELTSPAGAKVKITGIEPRALGTAYLLDFLPPQATKWSDYCGGTGAAVALHGMYGADRTHQATDNVSFACPDGTGQKCVKWGYIPGVKAGSEPWRHHQACTRMASFDICGDGTSHTRELTPIVIRDLMPGAKPGPLEEPALQYPETDPAPPDVEYFEAGWSETGAVCLAHRRWKSVELDGPCSLKLPDPRMQPALACDELGIDGMQDRGAILYSASATMDMNLNRWRNPTTGDYVSTVRGQYNVDPAKLVPPFPGYTEYVARDGILLRTMTGTLTDADVTPIYVRYDAQTRDYVVAPDTVLTTTHSVGDFEGYLLKTNGPDRVPFELYRRSASDYTSSDGAYLNPGWTLEQVLGFSIMR